MIIVADKHRIDLKSDRNVRTFFVVDMLIIIDFIDKHFNNFNNHFLIFSLN